MAHRELDLTDRRKIEEVLRAKVLVDEIATALGRYRATIYREISLAGLSLHHLRPRH